MIRALVACVVLASSIDAARIGIVRKGDSNSPFVASCEDLQGTYRSRVTAVQAVLDQYQNATSISTFAQARITMRVFGVIRTLRRARNCQWVLDGDSENIEQARSIVQQVLVQNPCAEAALDEMTPEAFESAANELQPLQRAMIVLMSESCEVPEQAEAEDIADAEDEDAVEQRLDNAEDEMQDHINELFDQAALESESMAEGSFAQTGAKSRQGSSFVLRLIGAVFLVLLVLYVCVSIAAMVGLAIGMLLGYLLCYLNPVACVSNHQASWLFSAQEHFYAAGFVGVIYGSSAGAFAGLGYCIVEVLPALIQDLRPEGQIAD